MSSPGSSCASATSPSRSVECTPGEVDHGRDVGDREVADPDGVAVDERGGADQRVVAVPAGDLVEGDAGARGARAGKNAETAISSWCTRRLERADVAARRRGWCAARPAPRPRANHRAGRARPASRRPRRRARASRPWCRGCGSWRARRATAPSRPAAAPGVRRARRARRRAGPARRSGRRRSSAVIVVQVGQPVDVDEHRGRGQPHRQQRDQALAAGQHLGPRIAGQGRHRFGERPRPAIRERRWFHSAFVTSLAPRVGATAAPAVHQVVEDDDQDRAERDARSARSRR